MITVELSRARGELSKLVKAVETGAEDEVIILRDGRPAVRLVALEADKRAMEAPSSAEPS